MSKMLHRKEVRLSEKEQHYCEVLQNIYGINPSAFIRQAFEEKLKRDIPNIRKEYAERNSDIPF